MSGNKDFAARLVTWQQVSGRHHLPWQAATPDQAADPYRVWVSEIMLQQTQVATVIPYFTAFMARFPDVNRLAAAPVESVLEGWAGLGYYARARNLHRCAQVLMDDFSGRFPREAQTLARLPGIGPSTAAAIAALVFGERSAILDGNVRRVLCRHFAVSGFPGLSSVHTQLLALAKDCLPSAAADMAAYTQGLMDLGATVCTRTRPTCERCPLSATCLAHTQGKTAEFPSPRTRKTIPQREVVFLLLRETEGSGAWLLERRPPLGLWGGLLAPVEFAEVHLPDKPESAEHIGTALAARGWFVDQIGLLDSVRHTFTHFRWHIQPWLCQVSPLEADTPPRGWISLDPAEVSKAALPAPIRRLLLAAVPAKSA